MTVLFKLTSYPFESLSGDLYSSHRDIALKEDVCQSIMNKLFLHLTQKQHNDQGEWLLPSFKMLPLIGAKMEDEAKHSLYL